MRGNVEFYELGKKITMDGCCKRRVTSRANTARQSAEAIFTESVSTLEGHWPTSGGCHEKIADGALVEFIGI
jgi:hypothetical protein